MKTEQTLMSILFALCATLVFGTVLILLATPIAPVATHSVLQNLPLAAFSAV
ncbi:MAG TPA: hypothetical protein VFJ15_08250 [Oleiagrimonas sp.]|nr:hypothetical protein [Oleiagrimonas sp.]